MCSRRDNKVKVFLNTERLQFFCSLSTVLLCGLAGFSDFYKADWLQRVLRLQDEDVGCFGRDSECLNSVTVHTTSSSLKLLPVGCFTPFRGHWVCLVIDKSLTRHVLRFSFRSIRKSSPALSFCPNTVTFGSKTTQMVTGIQGFYKFANQCVKSQNILEFTAIPESLCLQTWRTIDINKEDASPLPATV